MTRCRDHPTHASAELRREHDPHADGAARASRGRRRLRGRHRRRERRDRRHGRQGHLGAARRQTAGTRTALQFTIPFIFYISFASATCNCLRSHAGLPRSGFEF